MIISFYSYKGGVGRSQLCANIAAYLCFKKNKRVLLWDWDFEAPGLHYFFGKVDNDIRSEGTLEVFDSYVKMMRTRPRVSIKDFSYFSEDSFISLTSASTQKGVIDLIPAGNYSNDFIFRAQSFDWFEFYESLDGKVFVEHLKRWLKALDYDYILLDSRTGYNDYLGICNLQIPDANVVIMAANLQSIDGCDKIIRQILRSDYTQKNYRKSYIFPILSRISPAHPEYGKWVSIFADRFSYLLPSLDSRIRDTFAKQVFMDFYLDKTILTDEPHYSAGENILFGMDSDDIPRSTFTAKILNLAEYLSNVAITENIALFDQIDISTWRMYAEKALADNLTEISAIAFENAGDYERAIEVGGISAETFNSFKNLGNRFFAANERSKAVEYYRTALKIDPTSFVVLNNLGSIYLTESKVDEAILKFQDAIDLNPQYSLAWYNLGNSFFELKSYEQAVSYYQKAIILDEYSRDAYHNLGYTYEKLGKYEMAIESYERILAREWDSVDVRNNLGNCYAELKNSSLAILHYEAALSIDPKYFRAYTNLGRIYFELEDFKKAKQFYYAALEIRSDYPEVYNHLGDLYLSIGEFDQAVVSFRRAISLRPNYVDAYYNLGLTLYQMELFDEAEVVLKTCIAFGGEIELALLVLANVFFEQEKQEDAIEIYRRLTQKAEFAGSAYESWGYYLIKVDKLELAEEILLRAIECGNLLAGYMNLGHVYMLTGRVEKAIELYHLSFIEYGNPNQFWIALENDYLKLIWKFDAANIVFSEVKLSLQSRFK